MNQKSLQKTRPPAELEKVANRAESIARLGKASALGLGLKNENEPKGGTNRHAGN
jgi:hypothetical protein